MKNNISQVWNTLEEEGISSTFTNRRCLHWNPEGFVSWCKPLVTLKNKKARQDFVRKLLENIWRNLAKTNTWKRKSRKRTQHIVMLKDFHPIIKSNRTNYSHNFISKHKLAYYPVLHRNACKLHSFSFSFVINMERDKISEKKGKSRLKKKSERLLLWVVMLTQSFISELVFKPVSVAHYWCCRFPS